MTDFNKYNPYPGRFSIRCPRCGGEATFDFPFELLNEWSEELESWRVDTTVEILRWGGWFVVAKHPDLFPWKEPSGGYRRSDQGVCYCQNCSTRFEHLLEWPSDAYFYCEVKGKLLWAWSREHVKVLKSFIQSKNRKIEDYPGYGLFLHHIPKHFMLAKNRDLVVKKLEKLLTL